MAVVAWVLEHDYLVIVACGLLSVVAAVIQPTILPKNGQLPGAEEEEVAKCSGAITAKSPDGPSASLGEQSD